MTRNEPSMLPREGNSARMVRPRRGGALGNPDRIRCANLPCSPSASGTELIHKPPLARSTLAPLIKYIIVQGNEVLDCSAAAGMSLLQSGSGSVWRQSVSPVAGGMSDFNSPYANLGARDGSMGPNFVDYGFMGYPPDAQRSLLLSGVRQAPPGALAPPGDQVLALKNLLQGAYMPLQAYPSGRRKGPGPTTGPAVNPLYKVGRPLSGERGASWARACPASCCSSPHPRRRSFVAAGRRPGVAATAPSARYAHLSAGARAWVARAPRMFALQPPLTPASLVYFFAVCARTTRAASHPAPQEIQGACGGRLSWLGEARFAVFIF